ncbi:MAG: hypothetical protein CME61_06910 [Halobacteriovoraceae bacterium]|nr:hypothetical protein [Halobacteriovoraceae bacterium]
MATVVVNHMYETRQVLLDFVSYSIRTDIGPGIKVMPVTMTEEIASNGLGAILDKDGNLATTEEEAYAIVIDGFSTSCAIGREIDLKVITSFGLVLTKDLYLKNPEADTDGSQPKIIAPDVEKLISAFDGKALVFKQQVQKLASQGV